MYCIYLRCNNGSGYFVGTLLTSTSREIRVHPAKCKAKKFDNKKLAYDTARSLKSSYECVIAYDVVNY